MSLAATNLEYIAVGHISLLLVCFLTLVSYVKNIFPTSPHLKAEENLSVLKVLGYVQ
jgi:hypothetical protein